MSAPTPVHSRARGHLRARTILVCGPISERVVQCKTLQYTSSGSSCVLGKMTTHLPCSICFACVTDVILLPRFGMKYFADKYFDTRKTSASKTRTCGREWPNMNRKCNELLFLQRRECCERMYIKRPCRYIPMNRVRIYFGCQDFYLVTTRP